MLAPVWVPVKEASRPWERRELLGHGNRLWEQSCAELLRWEIKTRSGFKVTPQQPVKLGQQPTISVGPSMLAVHEPVEVVAVQEQQCWTGFAYRTLPGHPVRGIEAFILEREEDAVFLRVRSVTAPSDVSTWAFLFPLLLLAQAVTRKRYLRALKPKF